MAVPGAHVAVSKCIRTWPARVRLPSSFLSIVRRLPFSVVFTVFARVASRRFTTRFLRSPPDRFRRGPFCTVRVLVSPRQTSRLTSPGRYVVVLTVVDPRSPMTAPAAAGARLMERRRSSRPVSSSIRIYVFFNAFVACRKIMSKRGRGRGRITLTKKVAVAANRFCKKCDTNVKKKKRDKNTKI